MAAFNVPRWKTAITTALGDNEKAAVIQLATIDTYSSAKSNITIPHVRSHIFRGFLSAKSTPSLPLLLTTTDIRTPKISQIISNPHIEVAWWIGGTEEQYRIAGLAHIVSAPDHTLHSHFARTVSSPALAALEREGFDWEAKRKDVFNSMNRHMKATWCRPTPGSRLGGGAEEAAKWPEALPKLGEAEGEDEEKNLTMALGNFALVVIDPNEVDYVELGKIPNERTKFTRTQEGVWSEKAIVP